jgi:phosphoglycerate kinase
MDKKTVRDVILTGKRVLVRVDFNVPLEGDRVTDDTRIRAAIPTLKYILDQKPRALILMSHLGRPKGEVQPEYSMRPVVPVLSRLLGVPAAFAEDCVGPKAEEAVAALPASGVLVLENTRFHAGETKNDAELSAQMAKLGDIYVNDAFGSAHRAHASTAGVTNYLPAVAGFLMEKELEYLSSAVNNPVRPFVAILGGAKISDKIGVIEALLQKVDKLLIGGGMANTFFKAQDYEVGDSLIEADAVQTARELLQKGSDRIHLPVDAVIADAFDNNANTKVISPADGVPAGWRILDIGPKTLQVFQRALSDAKTVIWNGPMGVNEMENFAKGTQEVARMLAAITEKGAKTIIGGGDSVAAVMQANLGDKMTHISTGGGASLELLEGRTLPGVAALLDRE